MEWPLERAEFKSDSEMSFKMTFSKNSFGNLWPFVNDTAGLLKHCCSVLFIWVCSNKEVMYLLKFKFRF